MKKIALIASILTLCLAGFTQAQTVSITQIVEHPALDSAYKGIVDALNEAGFTADKGLKINHQSAQGNPAIATQIAKKFVGDKPDLIIAISTPSAQTVASSTKDIPIIFSAISNPIEAQLMTNLEKPTGNITGAMDSPPMEAQIDLILELIPAAKAIGIIYNPGEANSVSMVRDFKKIAAQKNINVVEASATKTSEVTTATRRLVGKVDAIYVPLDNTIVSAFESVAKVASQAKIPLFAADTDSVSRGAAASLGFDYYELGKQTGRMAVKVLQGVSIADIPAKGVEVLDLVINLKSAQEQGLVIPDVVIKRAKKVIK
ncbi:ABC transporter substrate-binding protein [Gammaproteobacteria bacterium]|nr:ABC transporter substrate-binding protein [Gammaproteobacteria bacterium]